MILKSPDAVKGTERTAFRDAIDSSTSMYTMGRLQGWRGLLVKLVEEPSFQKA